MQNHATGACCDGPNERVCKYLDEQVREEILFRDTCTLKNKKKVPTHFKRFIDKRGNLRFQVAIQSSLTLLVALY